MSTIRYLKNQTLFWIILEAFDSKKINATTNEKCCRLSFESCPWSLSIALTWRQSPFWSHLSVWSTHGWWCSTYDWGVCIPCCVWRLSVIDGWSSASATIWPVTRPLDRLAARRSDQSQEVASARDMQGCTGINDGLTSYSTPESYCQLIPCKFNKYIYIHKRECSTLRALAFFQIIYPFLPLGRFTRALNLFL